MAELYLLPLKISLKRLDLLIEFRSLYLSWLGGRDGEFEDKPGFYAEWSKNIPRNVQEANTRAGSQGCRSSPIQHSGMDILTGLSFSACLECDSVLAQGAKYQFIF